MSTEKSITIQSIGTIKTPYHKDDFCPSQPVERDDGESRLIVDPEYQAGLAELSGFKYIYVLFYLDQAADSTNLSVRPAWTKDTQVGLFASRSPNRPARIGLSIVKLKKIENNEIVTGLLDAYDGTPLLDIKPYINELDAKADANYGWIEQLEDFHHLLGHLRGIPHKHDHEHSHEHSHDHHHEHE